MTIDWWTLALQTINFLVLVWLLQRFLYKPVMDVIDRRRKQTGEAMAEADRAKAEAEASKRDYERRIDGLDEEKQRVLAEAHAQIGEERRRMTEEARREADEMMASARAAIEKDKAAALKGMRKEIADLAAQMASKLLGDVSQEVPNDVFLQLLSQRIEALPAAERRRLCGDLDAAKGAVTVVTARPLGRSERSKWSKRLSASLGISAKTKFETDRGLLGGAELHFPDAVLGLTWSGELAKIKNTVVQDGKSA